MSNITTTPARVSAAEFQNNFGRYADAARRTPVTVTRYGRDELVVLSVEEYERLRASDRRVIVLDETTPEQAERLLVALTTSGANPAAAALDYLMSDDGVPPRDP